MGVAQSPFPGSAGGLSVQSGNWVVGLYAPPVQSDTFISTTTGVSVTLTYQTKYFALQVVKTGTVTSWTIVLEGALDNSNFTTLLTHTNAAPGNGVLIFPATGIVTPVLFVRARCTAITLGGGTNVISSWLAAT